MGSPIVPGATAIQSAPIAELTSGSLEILKDLIKQVLAERDSLRRLIPAARNDLDTAQRRLRRAENWFFGLFLKKKVPERRTAVEAKIAQLQKLEERLSGAFIDADFALDEPTRAVFSRLTQAFEAVAECARIWEITSARPNDRRVTRSSAVRSLDRTPVGFAISEDPVLQTDGKVLRLENSNGADLLMYPGFILMQNRDDLALIDIREITVTYRRSRFIENETLPHDAIVVDHTWAKCNKDGSPDRRFANNYRIPVAAYGVLILRSVAGLNEQYEFSSAEKADRFAELLTKYQAELRLLGDRTPDEPHPTLPIDGAALPSSIPTDHALLKSIAFLQAATAVSGNHAIKIFLEFARLLKAEVDALSGNRSCEELETLVNELARVPDAVRSFLQKTPAVKPVEAKLLKSIKVFVCGYLRQARTGIDKVESKSDAMRRLLRLVCEVVEALQR